MNYSNMKKIIFVSILSGMLLSFGSCAGYLDMEHFFKDRLNVDSVFTKKDYSDQWLAGVYSQLQGENADVASKGNTPFNYISDDMFYGDRPGGDEYTVYKNGTYTENNKQGSWASCYQGIRDASTFIDNIDMNRQMSQSEIKDTKAQARFLRAYFYWLLIRKYGPVPILPVEGIDYTADYNALAVARNSYDECVDFITGELAIAAKDLPLNRSARYITRPTRGAALAARAKVYIYAASPLFNGNTEMSDLVDDQGRNLIAQTYDESKWARAAVAAKEVMDLGVYHLFTVAFTDTTQSLSQPKTIIPPYHAVYSENNFPAGWKDIDPFESYRQLFNGAVGPAANPELIFTRGFNQPNEGIDMMVLHQMPYTLKGWNTHGITLKHCDAYYMNDGSDVPTNPRVSGYTANNTSNLPLPANVSLQYANREPRFYASVAYNGSIWDNTSAKDADIGKKFTQTFYYRGESDGKQASSPAFHIRTGIGIKKYVNPIDSWLIGGGVVPKAEPAIRYAEVLLIYAEALNELTKSYTVANYTGEGSITVGRDVAEMSNAISPIRIRGGVPDFDASIYANADLFRKALKREREIELFAENHRYYDLRRWKDAPVEEATPVWGCNMNMTKAQRDLFYEPVVISSLPTIFAKKMYFWPISQSELKRNKKLTQNPGWTYYY